MVDLKQLSFARRSRGIPGKSRAILTLVKFLENFQKIDHFTGPVGQISGIIPENCHGNKRLRFRKNPVKLLRGRPFSKVYHGRWRKLWNPSGNRCPQHFVNPVRLCSRKCSRILAGKLRGLARIPHGNPRGNAFLSHQDRQLGRGFLEPLGNHVLPR